MSRRLEDLPNLGPASARMMREVGVGDEEALRELGPLDAYARLKALFGHRVNRNFLRALEGALAGQDWRLLPTERWTTLSREADALEARQRQLAKG